MHGVPFTQCDDGEFNSLEPSDEVMLQIKEDFQLLLMGVHLCRDLHSHFCSNFGIASLGVAVNVAHQV